jgi:hypothetical protein
VAMTRQQAVEEMDAVLDRAVIDAHRMLTDEFGLSEDDAAPWMERIYARLNALRESGMQTIDRIWSKVHDESPTIH